ncbi:CusA/CzcA family heavy metal efflux RND transporter [Pedobacter antarcticus]|uniref:CusA/CzcA family heavy metal efflux RND transporter n=1 Tax=Pedobacter antarcticus TaxID=34086 RepID=UPI00292ED694|nr:CusA/CzcA family heavy metal efflux RND transporter [Pedobacter antarcticus]
MLNRIIQFSVHHKLVIGLFMAIWILYGIFEVSRLPIDAVPDITSNQVQVITTAPALGAQDVERLITFPLEQALSSIPGLKESRSLSRFGLSLISITFDDDADIYWARQQITERLQQAEITAAAGKPELAPVTTGLGEIYQYVLRPKPGYEGKYSLAELRSIQDWSVRRQLLGTKGVADVSTFGGELKQYEVAINQHRLQAMNLTITDVFTALQANNGNTGGGYIEKGPSVLYIRTEGLAGSLEDIGQIVVRQNTNGSVVLVRDIADVKIGAAIRYGALTFNHTGEVTGAIVMMLKGENSSEVVKNVKLKVQEIQKTLPEGLQIEPFLDRSKMVKNAISTVENNLLEGALIVLFVLVLFLGNLRAGLIVASVIPLSMLFAIMMMNLFGVSGNLMSLGALDFGLIVDGAVIIVEAILHHMHFSKKYQNADALSPAEMNQEVSFSASRMMNAAVFGQIIILIVYLPILSLQGIEGKMFKPMAQTVAFAILGAFILSLTYVPMISSLCLSRKIKHKPNFSDRIMAKLENFYTRALTRVLRFRKMAVLFAVALFVIAIGLFMRMGGEFIPQLEEGDFAVETRLLVGTNLKKTTETFLQVSKIIMDEFPEVEKVVSRIGSAEIPTDPMPIEGGDMIIVMKDKKEWTSAHTFPDMATKMAAVVQEAVPGVTTGFQFPVQMRFNELMTGAKQDVVCKVYGEDLDLLSDYAEIIGGISKTVSGTADWYIEKVTGMPQIVIRYNRAEMARYGLDIETVNRVVNAAFAGAAAGKVYEGEKSFDLVVRVNEAGRKSVDDVRNLLIGNRVGQQIPLNQIADVNEIEGPNQIQRENARRRILVGFNVRGRDVQSIVNELQEKIATKLKMQPGYTIEYGGAFENLQQAKQRLSIAVPVALLLIFVMLYFAFSSVKEAALIYSAIPLSAIGGVFGLVLRDMPFSISAGVGFIALFGVAVLNGIVMIAEFNRIKLEGKVTDTLELVMSGTRNRLRPVLMTAAVASLGFLPMALSNGAGAEVQRPLATVVIGGLITATLLTLFILPALYMLLDKISVKVTKSKALVLLPLLLLMSPLMGYSQQVSIDLPQAIGIAEKHNSGILSAKLAEQAAGIRKNAGVDLAKTQFSADYGQMNSVQRDTRFGVSQALSFPAVYRNQRGQFEAQYNVSASRNKLTLIQVRSAVRSAFSEVIWLKEKQRLLLYADSIYTLFAAKTGIRFKAGEANIVERTTAKLHSEQITSQLAQLQGDLKIALETFNLVLQDSVDYVPSSSSLRLQGVSDSLVYVESEHPQVQLARAAAEEANWRYKTEKSKLLPDFFIGYNNQSINGIQNENGVEKLYGSSKRFSYVSAGINIPVFSGAQTAKSRAARVEWEQAKEDLNYSSNAARVNYLNALSNLKKHHNALDYYEKQALKDADIIMKAADQQFAGGDIDYLQWVILADQAVRVRSEYLDTLSAYNQSVIRLLELHTPDLIIKK